MALAALVAAIAAAGCGVGPGREVGGVELTVTRDYGASPSRSERVSDVRESDTVLRVLDRSADLTTRYGGKFVQSIDGVDGGSVEGRPYDWFFYVNGVESEVGAADYALDRGDRVWWDYRDWGAAMRIPAVVGSWPEPFAHGYDQGERTATLTCDRETPAACEAARVRLEGVGADLVATGGAIRVLVGRWASLRSDPAARAVEAGPESSGVFADFERSPAGWALMALRVTGEPGRALGSDAGLVAATRRYSGPPTWLVTGGSVAAVGRAARSLDAAALRDRYALAVTGDGPDPLPEQ